MVRNFVDHLGQSLSLDLLQHVMQQLHELRKLRRNIQKTEHNEKSAQRDAKLRVGCSKAKPKLFAPP